MIYSRISGTGSYLPRRVVTNQELEKQVDTTDEWIVSRTGIRERHIIGEGEGTYQMAYEAAQKALATAELSPTDIDLIIVATNTPDRAFPSTACWIQHKLGVGECPAFDVTVACAGFSYALAVADKFIRGGSVRSALVIGAESLSRLVDWTDRSTCVLFGDGAAAVILTASQEPGIVATYLNANGEYQDLLYADPYIKMAGQETFKVAVTQLGNMVTHMLQTNNIEASQIDWLIPHQANLRIIGAVAKKLDMPMERVVVTVDKHGNTSAASVPLALDAAIRDHRIQRGQTLLLESFGAGFAWGSALIVY